jgi:two-component system nitrogen regulation sensor histidine kinase GlnL
LAHELRNPLAGLKGAAQLLARRGADRRDRDERELIELIGSEIGRLNGLARPAAVAGAAAPHAR